MTKESNINTILEEFNKKFPSAERQSEINDFLIDQIREVMESIVPEKYKLFDDVNGNKPIRDMVIRNSVIDELNTNITNFFKHD